MRHLDTKAEEIRKYILSLIGTDENIDVDVFIDFLTFTVIFSRNRKNIVTQFDIPLLESSF